MLCPHLLIPEVNSLSVPCQVLLKDLVLDTCPPSRGLASTKLPFSVSGFLALAAFHWPPAPSALVLSDHLLIVR